MSSVFWGMWDLHHIHCRTCKRRYRAECRIARDLRVMAAREWWRNRVRVGDVEMWGDWL